MFDLRFQQAIEKNFLDIIPRLVGQATDNFNVSHGLLTELMKLTADAPVVQDAFVQLVSHLQLYLLGKGRRF